MQEIHCAIRKEWVAALPEELVRQQMLRHMMEDRGIPSALIAVEKSLKQMPHLTTYDLKSIPDRRADIICFAKGIHPNFDLYPLLLIECKAVKLNAKVITQVQGYNHFIRAYFIVIVNQKEIRTGWFNQQEKSYSFVDFLPSYETLIRSVSIKSSGL